MDYLWSPWRMAYVTGAQDAHGCVFCAAAEPDEKTRALLVHEGRDTFVILNLFPYNNGHLMVVPRRHFRTLADATSDELQELIELTRLAEMVLTDAYAPEGLNVGINLGKAAGAGVLDHLHIHLVPRWTGDTNFMTVFGTARVLPESLSQTAERLRPVFERLVKDTRA
ncbi:MAG: HIT domain-containing protein [Luteitalea sp.]|nr:HIT domain-containing protein [Luteitalea sp.]